MLHITNGDVVVDLLEVAGVEGTIVPWRDVLHEGPVPAGEDAATLRETRARFLVSQEWGDLESVRAMIAERDAELERAGERDEIVLWFEHDLYDQLQLAQILDRLHDFPKEIKKRLSLICVGSFPAIERFTGLGQLDAEQIASLLDARSPVSAGHLASGRLAWEAFRSSDPAAIETFIAGDTGELPFMGPALRRHLQQYPSVRDGLGRTEYEILTALAGGPAPAGAVFEKTNEKEEAPFMGDAPFWIYLERLAWGSRPVIRFEDAETLDRFPDRVVAPTDDGDKLLNGEGDFVQWNGIDRWLGGVHLSGDEARWRWDEESGQVCPCRI